MSPVLIYPNPLNPKRYVVLNSGFTFREYDYLNNARQVPKLPDFAVVDIRSRRSRRAPGGIVDAGFFDETWGYLPALRRIALSSRRSGCRHGGCSAGNLRRDPAGRSSPRGAVPSLTSSSRVRYLS